MFCSDEGIPKSKFVSSQNVAMLHFRVPKAGEGFKIRVNFVKNPQRKWNFALGKQFELIFFFRTSCFTQMSTTTYGVCCGRELVNDVLVFFNILWNYLQPKYFQMPSGEMDDNHKTFIRHCVMISCTIVASVFISLKCYIFCYRTGPDFSKKIIPLLVG